MIWNSFTQRNYVVNTVATLSDAMPE